MYLLPAYGRRYDSVENTLQDWNAGKDFKIMGGPYCSIRDFNELKKQVDIIEFVCDTGNGIFKHLLWIHPLKGVTTYV